MWQSLGFIPGPQNKTSWDCTFRSLQWLGWANAILTLPIFLFSYFHPCELGAQINLTSQYLLQIIIKCHLSKHQNRNRTDPWTKLFHFSALTLLSHSLSDPPTTRKTTNSKGRLLTWADTLSHWSSLLPACRKMRLWTFNMCESASGVTVQHWLSQRIFSQGQPQVQVETDTDSKGKGSWVWWLTALGKWEEGQELKTTRGYMRFHSRKRKKK